MAIILFHCQRRSLELSAQSCAADFQRVARRGTYPWRSDWHCRGCEQGARHAGHDVAAVRAGNVVAGARLICARCHRPADRFVHNRLCRSCDARDRELARGRNGKGAFPRELTERWKLHPVALWLVGRGPMLIRRSSSLLEAILTAVRTLARTPLPTLQVARPCPAYPAVRQLSFWGGC